MSDDLHLEIRRVVGEYARLPVDVDALADGDDLWGAGMASHASVDVMLALEDALEIEFPERLLRRSTFASIDAIAAAVSEIAAFNGAG